MKTFQDLEAVGENIKDRMEFVRTVINEHKSSEKYRTAWTAYEYFCHRNVTINNFKKILFKASGEAIEDIWGANYKMACRHFHRFLTQENQFLLGNGVQWGKEDTAEKLGNKKYPFDNQLQEAGIKALWGRKSYGFLNLDHIDVFSVLEFAGLDDEETGALRSGVRYWQIDNSKPLRATLYEEDGYTDMMFYTPSDTFRPSEDWIILDNGQGYAYKDKKPYIVRTVGDSKDKVDNTAIMEGENYPSFPIVPLYANAERQSEIVGLREQIDCYDLIKSGFANNVDEASIFYWTIQNAGGMEDVDLQKFIEQMKLLHASDLPDGVSATANTLEAPYNSREALLNRLDKDLYRDAMALDTETIASGATTATQIRAAYEPLNSKTDSFEYCVLDFIYSILELAGIEDEVSFTRSMIVNVNEDIQTVLQASAVLPEDYVTTKVLTLLGDGDKAEEIIKQMSADEIARFDDTEEQTEETEPTGAE